MQYNEDYVLGVLHDGGLLTRKQIDGARSRLNGEPGVLEVLINDGALSEVDVSRTLAAQAHMDWIDISTMIIPPQVINEIRGEDARRFKVIPVAFGESGLVLAVGNPLDIDTIDSLGFLLQRELELVCTSPKKIREALIKYYGTADEAADVLQKQIGEEIDLGLEFGDGTETSPIDEADAPIVRLVSMLLIEAHRAGASDIHLEPMDKKFRVRFRVDGVLQEMQSPPKRLQSAIISRLKIMTGSMSIAEKRLPQDGRIQVKIKKKPIDLRVSTMPTNHGESMVLRILDKSSLKLGLPELGFFSDDQEAFERLIRLADGIVLVTGPTGSGKTTTLYACLNYINKPDRKIITVEEPIEYQMTGINQVQVNTEIGMTFPAALRSILRQAPNIIMIGEIRDLEMTSIATNASLTGHLVFSTLHTNDAPSAVARLIDLGVQPFLVASSVRAAVGAKARPTAVQQLQTTGRTHRYRATRAWNRAWSALGRTSDEASRLRAVPSKIGYKGRMGIFEIFVIDDEVRHMINKRTSTFVLRQRARELGMRTLREDGVRKVFAARTSADEVISITVGDMS